MHPVCEPYRCRRNLSGGSSAETYMHRLHYTGQKKVKKHTAMHENTNRLECKTSQNPEKMHRIEKC